MIFTRKKNNLFFKNNKTRKDGFSLRFFFRMIYCLYLIGVSNLFVVLGFFSSSWIILNFMTLNDNVDQVRNDTVNWKLIWKKIFLWVKILNKDLWVGRINIVRYFLTSERSWWVGRGGADNGWVQQQSANTHSRIDRVSLRYWFHIP